MANAVRLRNEQFLDRIISHIQRGFVGGRSMLANVIDIEEAMLRCAASEERGAAIFFDFAAAFPRVSHDFLIDYFTDSGLLPKEIIRFVVQLYTGNRCFIQIHGGKFKGFDLSAGIRQGCPLSPLLFALAADLLLQRLSRALPRSCFRAYADDLAMISFNMFNDIPLLEPLVEEYYLLLGLKLHYGKSVIVQLFRMAPDKIHHMVQASGSRVCYQICSQISWLRRRSRTWRIGLAKAP